LEEYIVRDAHVVSGLIAFLMIAAAFCVMPSVRAELDIEVGDFWEYSMDMDDDGMVMTGGFKLKVDSESTVGTDEVFVLKLSGSGDLSGDMTGDVVSGSFDISGHQTRAKSDFNIMSEVIEMEMSVQGAGLSISMTAGFSTEHEPSVDDFIGDDDLSLNSVVSTTTETTETSWMNVLGMNESDDDTSQQTVTMTVVATNVTVTVPAGTFDCCKVEVEVVTDGYTDSTEYWYYSDEVGFYVKMGASSLGSVGDLELKDYGKDDGIAGLFSGINLMIMILVIVVIVVLIAILIGMRSRRGKAPMSMGPPQPGPEIPPPSPVQPPAPPRDTGPPPPGYPPVG
jgi:hypothetical protein